MAMGLSRPRVFFEISAGSEPHGRVVIELFTDQAPKTCENFRQLCAGTRPDLAYKLSPFHRIIDEFMIQGGDITKGDGTGGESIYGGEFDDENLAWREIDKEGLVCMANRGKATNSSQFFITLAPCEHLNGKHTVFGRVVSGYPVLEKLAKLDVDKNDRPLVDVVISRCGELERRKPTTDEKPTPIETTNSKKDRDPNRERRRRTPSISGADEETKRSPIRNKDDIEKGIKRREPRGSSYGKEHNQSSHRYNPERNPSASRDTNRVRSRSRSPRGYSKPAPNLNRFERREGNPRYEERNRWGGNRTDGAERYRGAAAGGDRAPRRTGPRGDGRLNDANDVSGGGGGESEIIFKGRGAMKFREKGEY